MNPCMLPQGKVGGEAVEGPGFSIECSKDASRRRQGVTMDVVVARSCDQ